MGGQGATWVGVFVQVSTLSHRGVGMIREIIRRTQHRQRAVAEELVDMPTGVYDSRHHDLEQGVEAGDGVLGGVRVCERGELAHVDEHHRHLAALTGEHIITLFKQARCEGRVDVSVATYSPFSADLRFSHSFCAVPVGRWYTPTTQVVRSEFRSVHLGGSMIPRCAGKTMAANVTMNGSAIAAMNGCPK
jgi:hypothetical protein